MSGARGWFAALAVLVAGCPAPAVVSAPAPDAHPLPAPNAAREALVEALSSGRPERVWAMLGPGPRARFGDEATFSPWCRKYCAEWLVQVLALEGTAQLSVGYGDVRLVGDGQRFWVDEAPGLPERRSAEDALAGLRTTLVRLADDTTFDATQRAAWLRLAEGLGQALERGIRVTAGTPLVVDGGEAVLNESAGHWTVVRFEATR